MLNHTKKIKEIYENIQKRLYYMIPEKWEKLCLYSSVLDKPDKEGKTGELFFYYIPKGIFKKKPVNVYEIPAKFNVDENQYLKLVKLLYEEIKRLRKEFQKSERKEIWTNLTLTIQDLKFVVEYDYTDLNNSIFSSYERHVIWRYENLGIGEEQVSKEDREVLKKYKILENSLVRKEHYEAGIYIKNVENMIAYSTQDYKIEKEPEEEEKHYKNQLLQTYQSEKKQENPK